MAGALGGAVHDAHAARAGVMVVRDIGRWRMRLVQHLRPHHTLSVPVSLTGLMREQFHSSPIACTMT